MEEQKKYALTTFDNPYNPFVDFEKWYIWDMTRGYDCCGYLDRFAKTSDEFTDEENQDRINEAIDRIIELDPTNNYTKVEYKPEYH